MIIWGFRRYIQQLAMVTMVCQGCYNPSAHAVRRALTKFTLFFIPLFPISSRYFVQCTFCGLSNKVTKEQANELRAQAQAPQQAPGMPQPYQQQQFQGQPPQHP